MSAKALHEYYGKQIITNHIASFGSNDAAPFKGVLVGPDTDLESLPQQHPWLLTEPLVAKPDQLIKRRGKLGLVLVKKDFKTCCEWIKERMAKDFTIGQTTGKLNYFIIEPFCAHQQSDEYYLCFYASRQGNHIYFYHEGGVDVGDVDAKAEKHMIPVNGTFSMEASKKMVSKMPAERQETMARFLKALYDLYDELHFTYMEINPIVMTSDNKIHILDLAAKIDETANFEVGTKWGELTFPAPFGRESLPEERKIAEMDGKTGASLKLTVLNPNGRIWTMVAGGGASVVYADTICGYGYTSELANYGEYSGAPNTEQTYQYAATLLDMMTRKKDPEGRPKLFIVGGGIANFTNVAATFKGLVKALREYDSKMTAVDARVYIRRAGPNYQEGLQMMRELDMELQTPIEVYGPETHMTAIVAMAVGKVESNPMSAFQDPGMVRTLIKGEESDTQSKQSSSDRKKSVAFTGNDSGKASGPSIGRKLSGANMVMDNIRSENVLFTSKTRSIVYGMQPRAVQGMLDFDFTCGRETPSVAAMIYPFGGFHTQKFYWGTKEVMVPCYPKVETAVAKHPDVDVVVNFASFRSAYDSTKDVLKHSEQIKVIAIIAEGIPEKRAKQLLVEAAEKDVIIIGPATVGGIKPGCFRIGNTGGMLDNIISSKLYRPGCVAYVSRSGGMSNELNNIISRNADGVYEGVAIGGDRYPGSTFIDHLKRYQAQDGCKMMVLLGEVGGVEEYELVNALKNGTITKPVVAWCIGTCATMFTSEVQFGHAGACANADQETSVAKNAALKAAGAVVPENFDELGVVINATYNKLLKDGVLKPLVEPPRPTVPIDYKWAQELGLIRKPTSFVSTISDERGEELVYCNKPISKIMEEDIGIGGVLSLLWMKRELPAYATKFIEMCLMITADHGPAVSGAHNTIVTARAGKDMISSIVSGMLTIGDRFGGALDGAAKQFSEAFDKGQTPREFVDDMRNKKTLIMGIGHRVKSINNPDKRVEIMKAYVKKHFPATPLLDFALKVEEITTSKKANLILNVDGVIGIAFVDLMRNCGKFSKAEADGYIALGMLNGLFVYGRTLGFIAHFLDQKRLKQGLYRHDWDDISYVMGGDVDMSSLADGDVPS